MNTFDYIVCIVIVVVGIVGYIANKILSDPNTFD